MEGVEWVQAPEGETPLPQMEGQTEGVELTDRGVFALPLKLTIDIRCSIVSAYRPGWRGVEGSTAVAPSS